MSLFECIGLIRPRAAILSAGLCLLAGILGFWSQAHRPNNSQETLNLESAQPLPKSESNELSLRNENFKEWWDESPEMALIKASAMNLSLDYAVLSKRTTKWLETEPTVPLRFLYESSELQHPLRQQLFLTLLPAIIQQSPAAGLEFARSFEKDAHKSMHQLVEHWVEIEPVEALEHVLNIDPTKLQEELSKAAFQAWLNHDSEAAVDWLLAIENKATQKFLLDRVNYHSVKGGLLVRIFNHSYYPYEVSSILSERLAQGGGANLLEVLQANPENGHLLINNRIGIRDRAHFEAAMAAIPAQSLDKKLHSLVQSWAKSEPQEALQWVREQHGTHNYERLLDVVYKSFSQSGIGLEFIDLPDMPERTKSRFLTDYMLQQENPMQWAKENLSGTLYGQVLLNRAEGMSKRAYPAEVMEILKALPEGKQKDSIIKSHLETLTPRYPEQMLELIRSQSASRLRREQTAAALENWISADPGAAQEYLSQVDWIDTDLNAKIQLALARQVSRTDKTEAIRLLQALPEENGRNYALNTFLEDLCRRGNYELVQSSIEEMPHGSVRNQAMLKVLDEFAYLSPKRAYDWIKIEQDQEVHSQAVRTISHEWIRKDSRTAEEWILTLPPGKGRDQAVRNMVAHESAQEAHKSAFDWALTIQDELLRKSELRRIYNKWTQGDPDPFEASRAVNDSSHLSEHEKERLLQQIK